MRSLSRTFAPAALVFASIGCASDHGLDPNHDRLGGPDFDNPDPGVIAEHEVDGFDLQGGDNRVFVTPGFDTYLTVHVGLESYGAWCLDPDVPIYPGNFYDGQGYSLYDERIEGYFVPGSDPAGVNWILERHWGAENPATIQTAIWDLVSHSWPYLEGVDIDRAAEIADEARDRDPEVPDVDDFYGIALFFDGDGEEGDDRDTDGPPDSDFQPLAVWTHRSR